MEIIDFFKQCLNPVLIIFAVIFLGCCIGKLQIKGISLDLSGVLILAVIVGVLILFTDVSWLDKDIENNMELISSIGTSLFVSTVGLTAGYSFDPAKIKLMIFVLLGAGVAILNFLVLLLISAIDSTTNSYFIYGVFCGAMTSTPGLTAICENSGSEPALIGYGQAYLIGVLGVVLFVQLMSRKKQNTLKKLSEDNSYATFSKAAAFQGLLQISAVTIFGTALGTFSIPKIGFSVGSSGGILIVGILLGIAIKKTKHSLVSEQVLSSFRSFGLVLFFVGSGIPAGLQLPGSLNYKGIVYGVVFAVIPIAVSYLLFMALSHKSREKSLSAVCGVMTSTPAMGVLLGKSGFEPSSAVYSFTYTGALLAIVICMRLL